ncbi:MAG: hypothetical protein KatS3mg097_459 [Candidatus Parcubacteria bacterium]|nr:MAG: hypothetical protein KatS3mg097_459 [Candidatus Parcubacteria bacterium]
MFFIKFNGLILDKRKIKESDALIYILTEKYGIQKCFLKSAFKHTSKNLGLSEIGNINKFYVLVKNQFLRIISMINIKIPNQYYAAYSYEYLWALKLIKKINLLETPTNLWFILINLENYIYQSPKTFKYWFIFHLMKEIGYEIELRKCYQCNRKLTKFAFFDNKQSIFCGFCAKNNYQKISNNILNSAFAINNIKTSQIKTIPDFLKKMIKNRFKEINKDIF